MWGVNLTKQLSQLTNVARDYLGEEEEEFAEEEEQEEKDSEVPPDLKSLIHRQQQELHRMRLERDSMEKHITELEQQLSTGRSQEQDVSRQYGLLLSAKDEEVNQIKAAMEREQKLHAKMIQKIEAEKSEISEQFNSFRENLKTDQHENELEHQELLKLRTDIIKFRQHLLRTQEENSSALVELQNKLDGEKATSDALRERITQLEGANNNNNNNNVVHATDSILLNRKLEYMQTMIDNLVFEHQEEIECKTYNLIKENASLQEQLESATRTCRESAHLYEDNAKMSKEIVELTEKLEEQSTALAQIKKDYDPLKEALSNSLAQLHEHLKSGQDVIDKRIVSKLIITYITSVKQRQSVLILMSSILNFDDKDKLAVGLLKDPATSSTSARLSSWVQGWFTPPSRPMLPSTTTTNGGNSTVLTAAALEGRSLTDLWVEFLLQEAQREEMGGVAGTHEEELHANHSTAVPDTTSEAISSWSVQKD